jgi:Fe-Mn family superoxide dismutase
MAHELPPLPYAFDALEPHIDARTMEIHHDRHHAAYVANLNNALEGHDDLPARSIEDLLSDIESVPDAIRQAVINNGGGHANHSMFWTCMAPGGGGEPAGALADAIAGTFGSFDDFKQKFAAQAMGRFGSGWAWFGFHGSDLHVGSTANQDSPIMIGHVPILGLDVWEHAYYLKYQNKRADYIDAWWSVVDWNQVARRFDAASA